MPACLAQESSTVSLNNGVQVRIAASLGKPTGEEQLTIELARASGDSFYRIFRDQNNLAVFAYELVVNLSADGSQVRFTAKPAEDTFAARFPGADAGKPVPSLSTDQDLGPLSSGQSAEIGLFEIPGMGLSVKDDVQVRLNQEAPATPTDGQFRLAGVKVSINGMQVAGPGAPGSVSGRYAMFYIPGRGGYFFSTDAPAGRAFVKAGSIDQEHMTFTLDNDQYDCTATAPFVDSPGGEVWVYHDPGYQPEGNWTQDFRSGQPEGDASGEFFTAASDSLNWWLP